MKLIEMHDQSQIHGDWDIRVSEGEKPGTKDFSISNERSFRRPAAIRTTDSERGSVSGNRVRGHGIDGIVGERNKDVNFLDNDVAVDAADRARETRAEVKRQKKKKRRKGL